jgi:hypothetical protein
MSYGRGALALGGLLTISLVAGQHRNGGVPAPASPASPSVPPVALGASNEKIASKRKIEKPAARRVRGERLAEKGEAFGGGSPEPAKADAATKAKSEKPAPAP